MGLQPELCAQFHRAVELIGRRWTGAVIQLLLIGRRRYAELRDAIPDISDRMLSERLRELEREAIVARIVVPETPVRVEYELTAKGRALERSLAEIGRWAQRWITEGPPPEAAPDPTTRNRRSAKAPRPAAEAPLRAHR
jgi:DNA-binding HxlR family transcriptional regulator